MHVQQPCTRAWARRALVAVGLSVGMPTGLLAQAHVMVADPLGLPMTRMASGTAWLPDSAPMYGVMRGQRAWSVMLHGTAFAQYVSMPGPRGASQLGSINWGMINAMRAVAGGRVQLRAMGSLEAFTVGGAGYPLLLQSGESYRGAPIHDRQHPHDLAMELAAVYERGLTPSLALQLYAAPVGEPALGPVAFPHRPSAAADPFATIAHHWQDASHVTFGVLTAGLYSRRVKVEGSLFNGREPDDIRTNLDFRGARLDSYSARVTVNPLPSLSAAVSYGHLTDAEVSHPGEAVRRATASVLWSQAGAASMQSLAVIAGANAAGHGPWTPGLTVEGLTDWRERWQLFARAELVQKSGEELALPAHAHHAVDEYYRVGQLSVGVLREVGLSRAGRLGVGTRVTVHQVPASLSALYGSRTPLGMSVYLRWRTARMAMAGMDMAGHAHHH